MDSFHLCIYLLPFINRLCFLYLKTPKVVLDFNLFTFLPVDSTLTRYCSNLKNKFEELSIIFLICEFVHSKTIFLCIFLANARTARKTLKNLIFFILGLDL